MEETKRPEVPKDCSICGGGIHNVAVYECNHAVICSKCFMMMNQKKDRRCAVCRRESKAVVITTRRAHRFDDYLDYSRHRKLNLKPLTHDDSLNAYFTDANHQKQLLDLVNRIVCPICCSNKRTKSANDFNSIQALQRHLLDSHDATHCTLCLADREVILRDQAIYSPAELKLHVTKDHSLCLFCNEVLYSDERLWDHLIRTHLTCHICDIENKNDQIDATEFFLFFNDHNALAYHHKRWHYCCPAGCPFVCGSFPSVEALGAHVAEHHREMAKTFCHIPSLGNERVSKFDFEGPLQRNGMQVVWAEGERILALRYFPLGRRHGFLELQPEEDAQTAIRDPPAESPTTTSKVEVASEEWHQVSAKKKSAKQSKRAGNR